MNALTMHTTARKALLVDRRVLAPTMTAWSDQDMNGKKVTLPVELDEMITEDTPRPGCEILWAAFLTCYATEQEAIAAAKRNTGTILPCEIHS